MRPSRLTVRIACAAFLLLASVAGPAVLASGGVTGSDEKYSIGSTTSIPNLSDGSVHVVKIEYLPGTLRVFLDDLGAPVLTVPLDLDAVLSSTDGTAWVGFTSATGLGAWENHDILSFTFGPSASAQSTVPLQLVDDAEQLEDRLRLTPSVIGKRGAAWTVSKQAVRDGFVSVFRFQITDLVYGGADGFAFVVQNWDGLALIGGGGGLGYTGMAHALAVEFDTWWNPASNFGDPDSVGDPNDNHVSVHVPLPDLGRRFDSEVPFSPGVDWEPDMAADPSSSYVYMVVTGFGRRECRQCAFPSIQYRVSPDGGNSWGPVKFVCGANCRAEHLESTGEFDPRIKVANDGTVFVAWLDGWNAVVARSFDHGETFTLPVNATQSRAGWADFPHLAISPDGKDVYIASNSTDPFIVASHDGGATFGNPVRLVPPTNKRIWFADGGVVAPDGTVYYSISVEGPFLAGGNFGTGPVELTVVRSQDKGATWSIVSIDRSEEAPRCAVSSCISDEFQAQIAIDMDAAGTLLVAYMRNTQVGEPKKFFSRTSVDGVSWSAPSLINDRGDSNFPVVSHGPTPGDFRVAWQDNRNGPFAWNTWYKRTTDGGNSWIEEARLSDVGHVTFYKSATGYVFPYGDYFGLATDARGANFLIWGEGTSREGAGGCWFTRGE